MICLASETEEDDVMLLCCDVKCGHVAHRSCVSGRYQTPRNVRNPDRPAVSAVNWHCPFRQHIEEIASVEEVRGAHTVDKADCSFRGWYFPATWALRAQRVAAVQMSIRCVTATTGDEVRHSGGVQNRDLSR